MSEKVISEIRFVETDDGFRIEFKGDKERLRKTMGFGPGKGFWRGTWGPGPRRYGKGGHWSHRHGPGFGFGPWGWWDWEEGEFEEDEPPQTPPKDV
jgi:hypothetical protein